MKKNNIKLLLSILRPLGILALLRHVRTAMTTNPNFPEPLVKLADMLLLADELAEAIDRATNGGKLEREKRDKLVAKAKEMLNTQANYVRAMAKGDAEVLVSSGFELQRVPQPLGVPQAPVFKLGRATGRSGELDLRWNAARGVDAFRLHISTEDPAQGGKWEEVSITTKGRFMVTDLESYKAYWFGVTAIGAAGESALSEPLMGRAA